MQTARSAGFALAALAGLGLAAVSPAQAGTITFENVPSQYLFLPSGGQNLADYYQGVTFGPDVTILDADRAGSYNSTTFPPHSGSSVAVDEFDALFTITFAAPSAGTQFYFTNANPSGLADVATATLFGGGTETVSLLANPGTNGMATFAGSVTSISIAQTPGFLTIDDLSGSGSSLSGAPAAVPEASSCVSFGALLLGGAGLLLRTRKRSVSAQA